MFSDFSFVQYIKMASQYSSSKPYSPELPAFNVTQYLMSGSACDLNNLQLNLNIIVNDSARYRYMAQMTLQHGTRYSPADENLIATHACARLRSALEYSIQYYAKQQFIYQQQYQHTKSSANFPFYHVMTSNFALPQGNSSSPTVLIASTYKPQSFGVKIGVKNDKRKFKRRSAEPPLRNLFEQRKKTKTAAAAPPARIPLLTGRGLIYPNSTNTYT